MPQLQWERETDPANRVWQAYFHDDTDQDDPTILTNVQRVRQEQQQQQQAITLKSILDLITFGLLPFVMARLLRNLLSAAAFSSDLFDEISLYLNQSRFLSDSLLQKFSNLVFEEASLYMDPTQYPTVLKTVTVVLYLLYSVSMSGYIVFTSIFYIMCLTLTTLRRWRDLGKFLMAVFKVRNGVL